MLFRSIKLSTYKDNILEFPAFEQELDMNPDFAEAWSDQAEHHQAVLEELAEMKEEHDKTGGDLASEQTYKLALDYALDQQRQAKKACAIEWLEGKGYFKEMHLREDPASLVNTGLAYVNRASIIAPSLVSMIPGVSYFFPGIGEE